MEHDPIRLRVTAETCRRLLGEVHDPLTVARLTSLAEERERKVRELAEHFSDPSA